MSGPDLMAHLKASVERARNVSPQPIAARVPPYVVVRTGSECYAVRDGAGNSLALCWTREVADLLVEALTEVES